MNYRVFAAYFLIVLAVCGCVQLVPKWRWKVWQGFLSDLLYLLGSGAIVAGLWQISQVVGLIAAGVMLYITGWLISVGGDGK